MNYNNNNKRYYWLKLKTSYFNQLTQKKMQRQQNGRDLQVIYLKMLLASIEHGGIIQFEGVYNTLPEEIADNIGEPLDLVEQCVDFLKNNGLVEMSEDGAAFYPEAVEMTGSECDSAERVRQHRSRQTGANVLQCNTDVTDCNTDVTIDNREREKIIDIEIEKREKIKELEKRYNSLSGAIHDAGQTKPADAECGTLAGQKSVEAVTLTDIYCQLRTNRNDEYFIVTLSDLDWWAQFYPGVDVKTEFKKMAAWSEANPANRKTKKGMKRFINSWLSREQDRGGKNRPGNSYSAQESGRLDIVDSWV